jgi:predicted RNA-binding protein with PIN domain
MPYLIDGHNLIPKIGLRLDSLDDEAALLERLGAFCRLGRKRAEVHFDGAQPGQATIRRLGRVTAHFVRAPRTADEAIRLRLMQLGKAARNWTVVSSDHRVQAEGHAARASVLSSEDFARQVIDALRARPAASGRDALLTPDEVEEWLAVFEEKRRKS